jgi:hypothetical protein
MSLAVLEIVERNRVKLAELLIRIRIGSGFKRDSGSGYLFGIRIWIQEGKKEPQK